MGNSTQGLGRLTPIVTRCMQKCGVSTLRIPSAEIRAGDGPALRALAERVRSSTAASDGEHGDLLDQTATLVHWAALALVEAVQRGFLAGDRWVIHLDEPTGLVAHLLPWYLHLLRSVDDLWGVSHVAPMTCLIETGGRWTEYRETDDDYEEVVATSALVDVRIALEPHLRATQVLPESGAVPAIVVRGTDLPWPMVDPSYEGSRRIPVRTEGGETRRALRSVLQAVFAKDDFHAGQYEAIAEVLEGRDCAVLLPTGAGKSLVYQLAGLCLPGPDPRDRPAGRSHRRSGPKPGPNGIDRVGCDHL